MKYTGIGLIVILIWGCILPLVRLAAETQGLLGAVVGIQGIAGVCGLTLLLSRGQVPLTRRPYMSWAFALRMGFFLSHIFAVYAAVRIVERSVLPGVIFCNYLWPSLVLLYSVVIAKIAVPRPLVFGLGISIVVLALLLEFGLGGIRSAFDSQSVWGLVLAFIAAHAWGLYSAITRRFGEVSGGSAVGPIFQLVSAMLALLVLLLRDGVGAGWADVWVSWPILVAGFANFVAYLCWDIGISKGGIVTLSLLADFIPWLSLAATSMMLGVGIKTRTILSAAILVVGALTARLGTIQPRIG